MCQVYIHIFSFVWVTARGLELSVASQTDSYNAQIVTSPENDEYVAEEKESIFIKCVSENHFSRNSSLIWNINTKVKIHIPLFILYHFSLITHHQPLIF